MLSLTACTRLARAAVVFFFVSRCRFVTDTFSSSRASRSAILWDASSASCRLRWLSSFEDVSPAFISNSCDTSDMFEKLGLLSRLSVLPFFLSLLLARRWAGCYSERAYV